MKKIHEIKKEVEDAGIEPVASPLDRFCSIHRSKVKIKRPESNTIVKSMKKRLVRSRISPRFKSPNKSKMLSSPNINMSISGRSRRSGQHKHTINSSAKNMKIARSRRDSKFLTVTDLNQMADLGVYPTPKQLPHYQSIHSIHSVRPGSFSERSERRLNLIRTHASP